MYSPIEFFFFWVGNTFYYPRVDPLNNQAPGGTVDFASQKKVPRFCSFLGTPWLARGVKLVGRFGRFWNSQEVRVPFFWKVPILLINREPTNVPIVK